MTKEEERQAWDSLPHWQDIDDRVREEVAHYLHGLVDCCADGAETAERRGLLAYRDEMLRIGEGAVVALAWMRGRATKGEIAADAEVGRIGARLLLYEQKCRNCGYTCTADSVIDHDGACCICNENTPCHLCRRGTEVEDDGTPF